MSSAEQLLTKLKHPGRLIALIGVLTLMGLQFCGGHQASIEIEAAP